jgi:hypothetical protein
MCMSLSPFFSRALSHFFDRYKNGTPCAPILASRCLVSFVPFSARFGFALRAFNLFAPSPCTSLCIWVYVCVRFALCMSAIDSLQTHTRMRACTHTLTHISDDGKRGTPRRWVEERQWQRKKEDHLIHIYIYILAHKMTVMLSTRYMTVGGQIYSRISFRSDDDNDDVPSSSISTQLRRYDFFFYIYHLLLVFLFFSLIDTTTTITLIGFFANIWMCICVHASPETVKMCYASLQ